MPSAPPSSAPVSLMPDAAPARSGGAASGISETGAELGGALGIAILGSIGIAIYRGEIADRLPPSVPAEVQSAASDTLGSAVAISGELPAQLGAAVLDTAREAFVHGMQLTSGIAAVVAVGLAVVAWVMLRANEAPPEETRSESAVAPPEQVAHIAPTQFRAAGG